MDLVLHVTQGSPDKEDAVNADEKAKVTYGRADVVDTIAAAIAEHKSVGIAGELYWDRSKNPLSRQRHKSLICLFLQLAVQPN